MAIGAITAGYSRFVPANRTTVALTDLVAILLIATGWAIAEATTASVVVVLCFNFFFLPPIGTFTIADPQNWVALIAFAPESRPTRDAARCRGSEVPGTGMGLGIVNRLRPPMAERSASPVDQKQELSRYCRCPTENPAREQRMDPGRGR